MNLAQKFPPLYECSVCGESVKVTPMGECVEPVLEFKCDHTDATVYANRKVTLYGQSKMDSMGALEKGAIRITLKVRDLLSHLLGRSI